MKNERSIVKTADGSSTLFDPVSGDHYHSTHGAEQEGQHVFINMGLAKSLESKDELRILEVGMGTGLNVILTWNYILNFPNKKLNYVALEPFPVHKEHYEKLNFTCINDTESSKIFRNIHELPWNEEQILHDNFIFRKELIKLTSFKSKQKYDLVYYDAFGPRHQPELWTEESMKSVKNLMNEKAVLVTYCAQGAFRRVLESLSFTVERLEGPPGKREMIRASLS